MAQLFLGQHHDSLGSIQQLSRAAIRIGRRTFVRLAPVKRAVRQKSKTASRLTTHYDVTWPGVHKLRGVLAAMSLRHRKPVSDHIATKLFAKVGPRPSRLRVKSHDSAARLFSMMTRGGYDSFPLTKRSLSVGQPKVTTRYRGGSQENRRVHKNSLQASSRNSVRLYATTPNISLVAGRYKSRVIVPRLAPRNQALRFQQAPGMSVDSRPFDNPQSHSVSETSNAGHLTRPLAPETRKELKVKSVSEKSEALDIGDVASPGFGAALRDYVAWNARKPPSGMTGYDPRLSPRWAGQQISG